MTSRAGVGNPRRGRVGGNFGRHRAPALAGVVVVALALSACGSRLSDQAFRTALGAASGQPADAGASALGTSGSSTGVGTGVATAPQGSTAAGSSRSSEPSVSSSTTTASAPAPSGATPPAPGTYRYAQSGSTTIGNSTTPVPQQGTIVIDPPAAQGPGTWSQTWHSYVDPSQAPSDTTYRFTPSGIFVTSEVIRQSADGQSVTFTCTFASPVEEIPWPIHTGYSFSGSGDCQSFTVSLHGQITTTRQVTLDGQPVTVYVVALTATTSGNLTSSDSENQWFAPSLRLLVHDDSSDSGSYGPFSFKSNVTRDLLSGRPA